MNSTWNQIEKETESLAEVTSAKITPTVILALKNFSTLARGRWPTADLDTNDYLPTLRLLWSANGKSIEVEIHEDHFELYEMNSKGSQIRHFEFATGTYLPPDLIQRLDMIFCK